MNAIILGSGTDRIMSAGLEEKTVSTVYGDAFYLEKDGLIFLPRHGVHWNITPPAINYRANIQALEDLGVEKVISLYSVSSISNRFYPGSFGIVKDFIDFTWGRENTFFDGVHRPFRRTAMVRPFDKELIRSFVKSSDGSLSFRGVYVCTNGPRYETASEVRAYRNMGADMVGMTLATEAELLVEAGIPNCAVAYSTGWAAGLDEEGQSFLEKESMDRLATKVLTAAVKALS